MKHLVILLLTAGIAMITACSSNDTYDEQESGSSATTEMAPAEKPAPAPEMPTKVEAEKAPAAEPVAQPAAEPEPEVTATSSDASTVTYVCTHGDSVRTIRVLYHDEGPKACEVTYEKSTGTQTLWNANSDEAYCEDRAAEFVMKQEGWGWSCNKE